MVLKFCLAYIIQNLFAINLMEEGKKQNILIIIKVQQYNCNSMIFYINILPVELMLLFGDRSDALT